jgi:hypothetical protein
MRRRCRVNPKVASWSWKTDCGWQVPCQPQRPAARAAAITHRHPTPSSEIERFAKAICGADNDPLLFEQACTIAENDFVLRAIHAQQLAVVERVREIAAVALVKGDNSLALVPTFLLG